MCVVTHVCSHSVDMHVASGLDSQVSSLASLLEGEGDGPGFPDPLLASGSHRRDWLVHVFTSLGSSALSRPQYPPPLQAGLEGWYLLVVEPECFAWYP